MDKDMRTLLQAIEKVVASDHRMRDKAIGSKQGCGSTDQDVSSATAGRARKQTDDLKAWDEWPA